VLCTELIFIGSSAIRLYRTVYIIVYTSKEIYNILRILAKFLPVILVITLTTWLDCTSFCDDGALNSPSDVEAPPCDSSSKFDSSSLEKEKESKEEYGLMTKVDIGAVVVVGVVYLSMLSFFVVLVYINLAINPNFNPDDFD